MTPFRFILSALLLAAPAMAQTPHSHSAAAPTTAVSVQPTPPAGDELDDLMWLDDADLMAFGLDEEMFIAPGAEPALGDFEHSGVDSPMAMHDEAEGGPGAPDMSMGHSGPGGMGHGGMGPGMDGGAGMHGGMGMHGGLAMMHRGRGRMMHMRMAQLDLTDAQRDKLHALHEANARKAVQRRADVQLAQMDLRKLMRADKPEQTALNAQVDRIAKLRADGVKAAIDTRLQARTVLTPEQWKKLHSPNAGMGHGMMPRGHKGGPGADSDKD